ncbi:sensor histidine kinase [Hymenobacter koreensis]|uniref:histidine kinase n=1 Tax=Hymenobacter koreensis TaxID=1084523 RepID=A0ABP8IWV5_9BACT
MGKARSRRGFATFTRTKRESFMKLNTELLFLIPLALVVMRMMRRRLDLATRLPAWDEHLMKIWIPGVVLLLIDWVWKLDGDMVGKGYWLLVMSVIMAVLAAIKEYRPARTMLLAVAPFSVLLFLNFVLGLISSDLEKEYDDTIEAARAFALIWLLTFFFIARGQKRQLEKERLEREEEEKAKRLIEAQNAELERLVAERTAALTQQADELRDTLNELKTTQAQLIQAEKMASLGELTAGIAHEIQNPLNFVNNFAEVSAEIIEELREEWAKGEEGDAELETSLIEDLQQNLQKITFHGQRASGIVRGMLDHSRTSTGERVPTDLNALADEYFRLAYHGLRAKDKTFNAALATEFDPELPKVTAVSQDVGRVLLNLFTNAFYAVQQRRLKGEPGYQPEVRVSTQRCAGGVELRVRDNGTGIPAAVVEKIFQPFFTTKPTGEGTGLGLSLSYDIVTQGHGGTLTVNTQEGQGTEFVVMLPTA